MNIIVKVIPKSKFNIIESKSFDVNNQLLIKVRVKEAPEDGKANKAVIILLAEHFGIKKSSIVIKSGLSSRTKKVVIEGLNLNDIPNTQLSLC